MRKRIHQYNNIFKEEYQKALQFLEKGCKCDCSSKLPKEEFAEIRVRFQALSKKEQDAVVMGQLLNTRGGKTSLSKRLKKKERVNHRTFYRWDHNTPICLETYLNMLGVSHIYLEYVRNHFLNEGLGTRTHSNTSKIPLRKTKMLIDQDVKRTVKNFIKKLAQTHGLPDPGRVKRITQSVIYLPTEMSYSSVYRDFLASRTENDKLKQLKYDVFRRLWHELTPNIKFMKPKTDLCDTCHKFRSEIHSCRDEKVRKTQKKNLINT